MKPVSGFPACKETLSGKFIWNNDDPVNGVDVPVWKQSSFEVDCTDEEDCVKSCSSLNAQFVQGKSKKMCYSYDILDSICIVIKFDELTDEYKYIGGCFKDNSHFTLKRAEQDKVYNFDEIGIEVRNKKDPVIMAGEISSHTYNFGASLVNII
jgi:hypothetical protein